MTSGLAAQTSKVNKPLHGGLSVPRWFVLPGLAAYLYISIWPAVLGSGYAFTDWNGLTEDFSFVGLGNFARILDEPLALRAVWNTVVLAFVVSIVQNGIGLALALALNSLVKSRYLLRTAFFLPVVLTPLVAGYIWSYLLAPSGAINEALRGVGLGALAHDWLGDPDTALGAVAITIIWQYAGLSMVIFMAGLQGIPREVLEASVIDGAGHWRQLISITLPLLNGAVVVNLLLSMISGLNQFAQVYVMTRGGPYGSTETISTLIFKRGFHGGDFPYGIALGIVLAVIVGGFAILQFRLTTRKVDN